MASEEQKAAWRRYYAANREHIARKKKKYRASCKRTASHIPRWDPRVSEAAAMDPVMSYAEIGAELGLTRARVGQIIEAALRKLRIANPDLARLLR